MSIAPFHPAPTPTRRHRTRRGTEARRTRLALAAAIVGIAAALIAYGISPTVRHAVGHAEHSVRHTVSNIFDRDQSKGAKHRKGAAEHHAKAHAKPGPAHPHARAGGVQPSHAAPAQTSHAR